MESQVEVDETFIGDKCNNMTNSKRKQLNGPDVVGKKTIACAKDRKTNKTVPRVSRKSERRTCKVL